MRMPALTARGRTLPVPSSIPSRTPCEAGAAPWRKGASRTRSVCLQSSSSEPPTHCCHSHFTAADTELCTVWGVVGPRKGLATGFCFSPGVSLPTETSGCALSWPERKGDAFRRASVHPGLPLHPGLQHGQAHLLGTLARGRAARRGHRALQQEGGMAYLCGPGIRAGFCPALLS